jgi:RNA polymerase sigma factor (sigma-70 family)
MAADHAYINRIKTDREKCLEELYLKYRLDFTEWANHKFGVEIEEAEDIFQDSLIVFYENVLTGRLTTLSSSLRTYLFAIGKHKILKFKKKLPLYANVEDVPDINLVDTSIEDLAIAEEKHKAVHSAMRLLGPDCQKILEMFYFEECNLTTVAKALNYKNENVAKVKKASCMRKLSGFMKGKDS